MILRLIPGVFMIQLSFPFRVSLVLFVGTRHRFDLGQASSSRCCFAEKNSREIFLTAMRWGDESWDAETMFLRAPHLSTYPAPRKDILRIILWLGNRAGMRSVSCYAIDPAIVTGLHRFCALF